MNNISISNYEKVLIREGLNELRLNIDNRIKQILKTKTYKNELKQTALNDWEEKEIIIRINREVEVLEIKEKFILRLYNEVLK